MKRIQILMFVFSLGMLVQGCSGTSQDFFAKDTNAADSGSGTGTSGGGGNGGGGNPSPTCTPGSITTTADLRIIFMVDNSGSTADTDPNYAVRKVSIDNFLTTYGGKANFTYNFGYFDGDGTVANLYDVGSSRFELYSPSSNYFGSSATLSSALAAYLKVGIGGDTPYQAAFNSMSDLISADAHASSNHYLYAVVFMSDGQPTDVSTNDMSTLANQLTSSAAAGRVALSTLYFGPESTSPGDGNAVAIATLQSLATAGNGKFVDSNKTTQIVISDLITVPGTCPN